MDVKQEEKSTVDDETMSRLFDFKVVSKFKDIYFKDLLLGQHVQEKELFVQTVKSPEDPDDYEETKLDDFYYEVRKSGVAYLLPSAYKAELPIEVTKSQKVGYKGNGYNLIMDYRPARFKPEKHHTFKELVDTIAPFKHSHFIDFTLYKIGVMSCLLDRNNIRCSSEPAFGKDSFMALLNDLTNNIGIIQNPTIAKLEYMSTNKILMCNEVINLEKKEIRDVEQYLLSTGAFSNKYTKRSRGSTKHGSREEYDISKLSLVICYNNKDCYKQGTTYFDSMFQKAVINRFPAFKFKGVLTEEFKEVDNSTKLAKDNITFYVNLLRSINWCTNNWESQKPGYVVRDFKELPIREKRILGIYSQFIALYAQTQEEYDILMDTLIDRKEEYTEMVRAKNDQSYVPPKEKSPFEDYEK